MDTDRIRISRDNRESHSGSAGAPSRIVARAVLLLALVAATVSLTQCQMVGDNLTGVQASLFKRKNECVRKCADAKRDADKAERKLHKDNEKACGGNSACLSEENARHDAAEDAIEAAYKACLQTCHNQGGGDNDDD